MSTDYTTQVQALSSNGGGDDEFVTKKWLIDNGNFKTDILSGYGNNDYVIDEHVQPKSGGGSTTSIYTISAQTAGNDIVLMDRISYNSNTSYTTYSSTSNSGAYYNYNIPLNSDSKLPLNNPTGGKTSISTGDSFWIYLWGGSYVGMETYSLVAP